MATKDRIAEIVQSIGRPQWKVISDIIEDPEFENILTDQQKSVLNNVRSNPNTITSYRDYFPDIVGKYFGWRIYKDAKLGELKTEVDSLSEQVNKSRKDLDAINKVAGQISGVTVLQSYSKGFSGTSEKHGLAAKTQFKYYMASLLLLLIVVWSVFFLNIAEFPVLKSFIADDMTSLPLNTGIFLLKAIMLFFAFQMLQFFRKNYNAEKHLEEVYFHRSGVLQSLHAVYLAIDDKSEKDKILSAGALFAFERGETGYITTKEGAGSGENLFEGFINKKLGF